MIARMTRHVSDINVMHPRTHGHLSRPLQSCNGRGREIEHLIIGMKPAEVKRHIGTGLAQDPVDERLQHFIRIVQRGNDQIDNFQMDTAPGDLLDAPEHRLEFRAADMAVKRRVISFEIHLDGVQHRAHLGQRRLIHEAATDQHGTEIQLFRLPGDVHYVLRKNRRLVVSEGNDRRLPRGRREGDPGRRPPGNPVIFRGSLRDFPVLAELAFQGTPRRCQRVGLRTGQIMIERLLFDGVHMDADGAPVNKASQLPVHIHAGPASSPLALLNDTSLGAEQAFDDPAAVGMPPAFDAFPWTVAFQAARLSEGR